MKQNKSRAGPSISSSTPSSLPFGKEEFTSSALGKTSQDLTTPHDTSNTRVILESKPANLDVGHHGSRTSASAPERLEAFGGCAYKSALYTPMLSFGKRFPEDATVASREHLQFWPSQLCPGAKLGWNPV